MLKGIIKENTLLERLWQMDTKLDFRDNAIHAEIKKNTAGLRIKISVVLQDLDVESDLGSVKMTLNSCIMNLTATQRQSSLAVVSLHT